MFPKTVAALARTVSDLNIHTNRFGCLRRMVYHALADGLFDRLAGISALNLSKSCIRGLECFMHELTALV
jgi:hypothetical protein